MIELLSFNLAESLQAESRGGLFDFNATLPLMALQFLTLMVILDNIFYKPVAKILDDRDEYIRNSLTTASASLNKANALTLQYEQELADARKDAQELIRNSQKDAQEVVSIKIKTAQKDAELLIAEASQQLMLQKEQAIKTLENQVEALSDQIKVKLLKY
uniref:ATP synthase subunit b', chloroplastic n=1 Tax=Liagora harveyana TaxID=406718 RepID=A0A1G4NV93_9FLOR|nr:ATP synthase CF0 subunit II [Liagora harveyana]SCW22567.1 ATP synthase CF0 subunit II [Liagora harveyana]